MDLALSQRCYLKPKARASYAGKLYRHAKSARRLFIPVHPIKTTTTTTINTVEFMGKATKKTDKSKGNSKLAAKVAAELGIDVGEPIRKRNNQDTSDHSDDAGKPTATNDSAKKRKRASAKEKQEKNPKLDRDVA